MARTEKAASEGKNTSAAKSAVATENTAAAKAVGKAQGAAKKESPTKTAAAKTAKAVPAEKIVFDPSADRNAIAEQALNNPAVLSTLVENLSTEARRIRQFSASAIGVISETNPEVLVAYTAQITDALYRPEAQTRWECLESLARIVPLAPDNCDEAVVGTEGSLYDEESGSARLAAMRFLCAYGAIDADRSDRVWSFIDEAIQCYHGDPEFQDMLISVIAFAGGDISKNVKKSLAGRMDFDAANAKGVLKRRAGQIIELCKKK